MGCASVMLQDLSIEGLELECSEWFLIELEEEGRVVPNAEWCGGEGGGGWRGRAKRVERFLATGALMERRGRIAAWVCMSVSSLTKLLCLLGLSGGVRDSLETRPGNGTVSEDGDEE